jgi:hypothetical protein
VVSRYQFEFAFDEPAPQGLIEVLEMRLEQVVRIRAQEHGIDHTFGFALVEAEDED